MVTAAGLRRVAVSVPEGWRALDGDIMKTCEGPGRVWSKFFIYIQTDWLSAPLYPRSIRLILVVVRKQSSETKCIGKR